MQNNKKRKIGLYILNPVDWIKIPEDSIYILQNIYYNYRSITPFYFLKYKLILDKYDL